MWPGARSTVASERFRLLRKRKGPSNRAGRQVEFACVHERAANQRKGVLHKFAIGAVRESQAIAAEDLRVRGMLGESPPRKSRGRCRHVRDDPPARLQVRLVQPRVREGGGDSTRRAGHAAITGASTADWRFQNANGIASVAESAACEGHGLLEGTAWRVAFRARQTEEFASRQICRR